MVLTLGVMLSSEISVRTTGRKICKGVCVEATFTTFTDGNFTGVFTKIGVSTILVINNLDS